MQASRVLIIFFLLQIIIIAQENPWGRYKPAETKNLAWKRYYIEGFAWPTSVLPGESIRIYVSVRSYNNDSSYEYEVYRSNDSLMLPEQTRVGRFFPLHDENGVEIYPGDTTRKPVEYKMGCRTYWESGSFTINIPVNWESGLYYVKLNHYGITSNDSAVLGEKYYWVPFVVRSLNPGENSRILFKFDITTLHAYNWWGGGSLYSWAQDPLSLTETDTIAIDRPFTLEYSQAMQWYNHSLEHLLKEHGYKIEYCNHIDLDDRPDNLPPQLGINLLSS